MRFLGTVSSILIDTFRYWYNKCSAWDLLHGLVNRLVSHDQELKVITSLFNSLDQLRGEESVADLSILGHDGNPRGELGVILGEGDGGIVTVIAELAHVALVNNSPDKAIVG